MADWQKIKTEYLTTNTSYRKLAQKYGLNASTLYARAGKEQWVEQKEQYQSETEAKTLETISEDRADRVARLMTVGDKLLKKLEQAVEQEGPMSAGAIKNLSDALKNIRDAQMIKSVKDLEEQDARIAKLQKEGQKEDKDKSSITITLEGSLDDYAR